MLPPTTPLHARDTSAVGAPTHPHLLVCRETPVGEAAAGTGTRGDEHPIYTACPQTPPACVGV
eukprot:365243-Chlamydomonas_euryale.AAC.3